MSRSYRAEIRLQKALREKLFRQRVRAKTGQFLERYQRIYASLCAQGTSDLLPEEMKRLRRDLDAIAARLDDDPVEARDISMSVGGYIHNLSSLARAAQEAFAQKEAERRAALQRERAAADAARQKVFFDALATMHPITAHFAAQEIDTLRQEIAAGTIGDSDIAARVEAIRQHAETQVAAWKETTCAEHQAEAVAAQVQDIEDTMPMQENAKTAELREKLRTIREKAAQAKTHTDDLQQELQAAEEEADAIAVSEDLRRACAESVVQELQALCFDVGCQLRDGIVEIYAQKPSGKRAFFQLAKNGKVQYTFDQYQGNECLKDIEVVTTKLDQCYGVHFSDERTLWENPDRLSADAYDVTNSNTMGRN